MYKISPQSQSQGGKYKRNVVNANSNVCIIFVKCGGNFLLIVLVVVEINFILNES